MTRCPSCPGPHCRQVLSTGPTPCPWLFLGAGPGPTEATTGTPYTGLAGEEFEETYLSLAGLPRSGLHIGNCSLCYDGDRVPDRRVLDCARTHLPRLLDRVRPEVVVLMGGAPCKIADTRIRLDVQHGIPHKNSLLGGVWEGWVVPMYEPALGMRDTPRMTQLMEDFQNLGRWGRGEWEPPQPEKCETDYALIETGPQFFDYVLRNPKPSMIAADTEKHGAPPWSIQFSHTAHTGRLIRADQSQLLYYFQKWIVENRIELALHFAGQDLDTSEKMCVVPIAWRDTGQEAFHTNRLPQGLKALAYRLFGAQLRSWEDVVWPASVEAMVRWLEDAHALCASNREESREPLKVGGTCRECGRKSRGSKACSVCGTVGSVDPWKIVHTPIAAEGVVAHILTHTVRTADDDDPYNPWKALTKMREGGLRGKVPENWEWELIETKCGVPPILGIGNCTMEEAVEYGCSDADWTLQVAQALERERGSERYVVEVEDYDR